MVSVQRSRASRRWAALFVVCLALAAAASPNVVAGASSGSPAEEAAAAAVWTGPVYYARVYLDGERVALPVPAIVAADYTMAPARALFERLGAVVGWDGTQGLVTVRTDTTSVQMWLGRPQALVDGKVVPLDAPPFIWEGNTLVPVRFLAETMGLSVGWDAERRAVTLVGAAGEAAGAGSEPGSAAAPREITLAFGGDTLLDLRIGETIKAYGPDYPWEGVAPTFQAADIAMVNLESCVSTRGTPCDKRWVFRARPETLAGVKNAGIDIVSVANNHVYDYGPEAFLDTLDHLEDHGLLYTGAGRNLAEATRPVIIEAGGYQVAFLAATQWFVSAGVAGPSKAGVCVTNFHADELIDIIARLKADGEADYVVVNFHWGTEGNHHIDAYQQELGRSMIDAGADLVIGHHPHLLQGIEVYKDRIIVYSLSNFVFTYTSRATMDSGIFTVTLDKHGIAAARLIPVYTAGGRPVLEEGDDYHRIIREVNEYSEPWGLRLDADGYVPIG